MANSIFSGGGTVLSGGNGVEDLYEGSTAEVRKYIEGFCEDVTRRIMKNFEMQHFGISPHGPVQFTGNLMRTIHYTITNAAGGNNNLVQFYYLNYGRFVETAVGHGHKAKDMTFPIPAVKGPHAQDRPKSDNYKRAIKPFISSEIRVHLRMILPRMAAMFGYIATTGIFHTVSMLDYKGGKNPVLGLDWGNQSVPRDVAAYLERWKSQLKTDKNP